ncbi:MAG: Maf family protein [Vampirovibrionales bacterium]|nr:Maf family protein [Vampirovibrionales bacterium]
MSETLPPKPLPPLILASGSPRRKELLGSLGLSFQVIPSSVDEAAIDVSGLTPAELVMKLAQCKAVDVAQNHPEHLVIGSDTIVVLDNKVFGKPRDEAEAIGMLSALEGRTHQVYTGISLCYQGACLCEFNVTDVTFLAMAQETIKRYVQTGEPMDKAGAYSIQGLGSLNIERISGCYFNVVGFSLVLFQAMLKQLGYVLY